MDIQPMETMSHFPQLNSDFNISIYQRHPSTSFDHHKPTKRLQSFQRLHRRVHISSGDTSGMKALLKGSFNWSESWAVPGDRTVFLCWIITAPSENSLFPVLEWLCLVCGGAGCRPNNRPLWLLFAPLNSRCSHTICVWESCYLSRTGKHKLHCWFWPLSLLAHHLISRHTHSMTCGERMCLFFGHNTTVQTRRWSHRFSSRDDVSSRRFGPSSKIERIKDCLSSLKNGANV